MNTGKHFTPPKTEVHSLKDEYDSILSQIGRTREINQCSALSPWSEESLALQTGKGKHNFSFGWNCPLNFRFYNSFLDIGNLKTRVQALNLLVLLLPLENVCFLVAFLKLLKQIVDHEEANRMSLQNVCHLMAPNVFVYPKSAVNNDMTRQVRKSQIQLRSIISNRV